jgi:DNA modification methylase
MKPKRKRIDALNQPATPGMKIEMWPIDRPKDYPRNARKWTAQALEKVGTSIQTYGWRQPVVVDRDEVIIIGHLRRASAKTKGFTECPVHVAADLTPEQARGLRLMDNRSHEEAGWDLELLGSELLDLKNLDFGLELTGFDVRELDKLLVKPNDRADDAPPLPERAISRPGDLWLMGGHRLLCGDATSREALSRATAGNKADAMWTDPPYGVDYVGKTAEALTIHGDSAEQVEAMLTGAFAACEPFLVACAPFYIAHPAGALSLAFGRVVERAGWRIHEGLVWSKDSMVLGHSDYHYQHEPIMYGFTAGDGRPGRGRHQGTRWYGDNAQTTVFNIPRPKRSSEHPTMKPVELIQRCLGNSVPRGGAVLDPFVGSGSTLAAAELMDRRCFAIEIDPRYVDVAVLRWQDLTGKQATLEGHGATFQHVKEGRMLEAEDAIKEHCEELLAERGK